MRAYARAMSAHDPGAATPAELLRRRVADDPSNPLVTFYDDATGERVELSARTFDNWVAKTANFLVDGLGAEPGTRVVLVLPPHWQTAVWLLACWSAGLVAEPVDPAEVKGRSGEPVKPSGPYILAAAQEVLDDVVDDAEAEEVVGALTARARRPARRLPARRDRLRRRGPQLRRPVRSGAGGDARDARVEWTNATLGGGSSWRPPARPSRNGSWTRATGSWLTCRSPHSTGY